MKLPLLVPMVIAVGCGQSPDVKKSKTVSAKAASVAKAQAEHSDPAPKATEETAADDPFGVGDVPERESTVTPEEYRAAEARQIAAKLKALEIEEAKANAEALLTPEERTRVDKIVAALEEHGLWGVDSVRGLNSYLLPLLDEALAKASQKRDPSLEIDRLLDSIGLDNEERVVFATEYGLVERLGVARMLAALHDGTWKGTDEVMFRYRGKPFFDEAIQAYKGKKR